MSNPTAPKFQPIQSLLPWLKFFEATKTLGLKRTNISVQESSEGRQNNQNKNKDEAKEYFANKSIKITTRDFEEIQPLLQSAAEAGFLMSGTIEYFLTNSDSLKSACIDKAVKIALERAKVAKKTLNGLSMSVLKITDSDDFDLYTSDDTKTDEEGIDKFFTNRRQYGFAAGRAGMARGPQLFYKISPAKIKVNSAIRILVKITTDE